MLLKGSAALVGSSVGGVGFATNKALSYLYVGHFFEGEQVASQISVGELEGIFELVEVHPIMYHQDRHNPQPDSVVECLVELLDDTFHKIDFGRFVLW